MPALDQLQASLGDADFAVIPRSIDRGGTETVRKFYGDVGVRNLAIYTDTSGQALRVLGAVGLPTTLIIDRNGNEVGRFVGPAEWDSPEFIDVLRPIASNPEKPAESLTGQTAADAIDAARGINTPSPIERALLRLKGIFTR